MIKSLLKSLGIACVIAVPGQLSAYTASDLTKIVVDGNELYFILDNVNYTATLQSKIVRNIPVPYDFATFTVPLKVTYNSVDYSVLLGEKSLSGSSELTTLVIPEGFTEIPEGFASECPKLSSVELPSTLAVININAFGSCESLSTITLPEGLKSIGKASDPFNTNAYYYYGAFRGTGLTEIKIPSGVEVLGDATFLDCVSLTKVEMSEGLKVIGSYCFSWDRALCDVKLPESLERIDPAAFVSCESLSTINLPENVNFIGRATFRGSSLTSINLPPHLTVLRSSFIGETPIEYIAIPAGVERINPRALETASLKTLHIDDSDRTLEFDLTSNSKYGRDPWSGDAQESDAVGMWLKNSVTDLYLGRNISTWIHPDYELSGQSRAGNNDQITNPMYGLNQLENITVGACVTDATQLVFENYTQLKSITFLSSEPPLMGALTPEQAKSVKVIVPEGSIDSYKAVDGWAEIADITVGIDEIVADETDREAEYFNLNGMKVANPSSGIFIKRLGNKITKVVL